MSIIRITTDNEISAEEFVKGDYSTQNRYIRSLIGSQCSMYEHVMPRRLYRELGCSNEAGNCVSMLIDEDGLYHDLDINLVGSWLYGTDLHGHAIVGNILIVGEVWDRDGIVFGDISDQEFQHLYPKLKELTE